jgi:transcriptional regulator with XRE-family HTH domain
MVTTKRTANPNLARLLDQAKLTRTQLAQRVNRLSVQAGLDLHYSQSTVSHWIRGVSPKPEVRSLIVEALSAELGRPVTHTEAGLTPGPSVVGSEKADTVEELIDLGRADMDPSRRGALAAGVFSAALAVPGFSIPAHAAERPAGSSKKTVRVGASQVEAVRTMTERIADILDELGAGHARPMAAAFLVNTIGPWLRARASEQVRLNMLAAASDLTYLTGWMAMYEKAHGLGQTYYVKALKLAREAQDHVTYCRTLRGMSLQASNLGYGQKALDLADSAAEAAPAAGPRLVAFLRGQQAHAASMVGDRPTAHMRLREAEDSLSKADNRRDAIGGYDRTAWLFHVSHVLYEERDLPGSIKALQQSIKVQPKVERQGRVHSYALLAQRQYSHGHLDASCNSWGRFLDEYEHVSSARGDDHFLTMRSQLRRHANARPVRELAGRAREVAALKS